MIFTQHSAVIGTCRLRLRRQVLDCRDTRSEIDRLFAPTDISPGAISDSAVLCIRRMKDPLPRCFTVDRTFARVPEAWRLAAQQSIDRFRMHAARPALGAVPAAAEAVLFLDPAELLACLAKDWCGGELSRHWWWKDIFNGKDLNSCVVPAWKESVSYVPGALELLAASGIAAAFASRLTDEQSLEIIGEMTTMFALANIDFMASIKSSYQYTQPAIVDDGGETAPIIAATMRADTDTASRSAPWEQWAPESVAAKLTLPQRCVLGIGLMLRRAPQVLRSAHFAATVEKYLHRTYVSASSGVQIVEQPMEAPASTRLKDMRTVYGSAKSHGEEEHAMPIQDCDDGPGVKLLSPAALPAPGRADFAEVSSMSAMKRPLEPPLNVTDSDNRGAAPEPVGVKNIRSFPEEYIATEWGGVFYFVNVGLFLGLYGDFTAPADTGMGLSPWDFIALMGSAFSKDALRSDPVWQVLAHCAGRTAQEEPGSGFDPPDSWIMPFSWLSAFPSSDAWTWDAGYGRLRVVHPEGFIVADVPLGNEENAERRLKSILLEYGAAISRMARREDSPRSAVAADELAQWLSRIVPFVDARLRRALGLSAESDLEDCFVKRQARLRVTPAHVDVVFSLDQLPVEVRLAGLDRNPGWVPAAGRHITFTYE